MQPWCPSLYIPNSSQILFQGRDDIAISSFGIPLLQRVSQMQFLLTLSNNFCNFLKSSWNGDWKSEHCSKIIKTREYTAYLDVWCTPLIPFYGSENNRGYDSDIPAAHPFRLKVIDEEHYPLFAGIGWKHLFMQDKKPLLHTPEWYWRWILPPEYFVKYTDRRNNSRYLSLWLEDHKVCQNRLPGKGDRLYDCRNQSHAYHRQDLRSTVACLRWGRSIASEHSDSSVPLYSDKRNIWDYTTVTRYPELNRFLHF